MRKVTWGIIIALLVGMALSACSVPDIKSESFTCNIEGGTVTYSITFDYQPAGTPSPSEGAVEGDVLPAYTHQIMLFMAQGKRDPLTTFPPIPDDDIPLSVISLPSGTGLVTLNATFPALAAPVHPGLEWPLGGQQFYVVVSDDPPTYIYDSPLFTCSGSSGSGDWFDPGDNRINPSQSAWGVIYPHHFATGDGLNIYTLNEAGQWVSVLLITPEMLASVPEKPDDYTFIAREGNVELYKLPTGQYQLNVGPDGEGKIMVTIFDDIHTGTPWYQYTVNVYDKQP